MTKKDRILLIPVFIALILGMSLNYGCGTQAQLMGGPRDTIPPKVLKMIPENLTDEF